MPLISVIVPVYKTEAYIHQCIDSILGQTFTDFELILVDDGSPDCCPEICDAYAAKDKRIRVIHKENGGLSSARNAGLDIAQGEYIAFVDSDDWITPEYLQKLLTALQKENAELAICNVQLTYNPDYTGVRNTEVFTIGDECLSVSEMIDKLMLKMAWFYIIVWNKLYHRSIFDSLRFPDGYIREDEATIHRIIGQCGKIVTISDQMYCYRQTPGSIMRRGLHIESTDNLSALADRIRYSAEKKWQTLCYAATTRFVYDFFDLYFRFPQTDENRKYFRRMEKSLKIAYPHILRCGEVSRAHKLYLTLIRIHPQIYRTLKRITKR